MSSPDSPILQKLDRLSRSTSGFHDQLSDLFDGDEYKQCVPNLQGDDLAWLVDYLDKVRRRIIPPHPPLKPTQTLDDLDPASSGSQKCLHELSYICGTRAILPTSYTLSSSLLNVGHHPVASGGSGDVYKGSFNGSGVCVKRVRVYSKDGPKKATKVHFRHHRFPCLPMLTRLTDALPGGCGVEMYETQKHRPPSGCYIRTSPAYFRLDARRGTYGTHRTAPRR